MPANDDQVEPSPSPGEAFDTAFTWDFALDQGVVAFAVGLGVTSFTITKGVNPISATSGATGDSVGNGGETTVALGDETVPVGFTDGPFTGTFTRTAAVDEPIVFTPGTITSNVTSSSGTVLSITCAPGAGALTVTDQDGVAPSTTTTTRPPVVTTTTQAATTTTDTVAGTTQGNQLPRTGSSSNLILVVLALGLIDIGYLALSAGQPPRRRRTSPR